jgi:hypothetical protein
VFRVDERINKLVTSKREFCGVDIFTGAILNSGMQIVDAAMIHNHDDLLLLSKVLTTHIDMYQCVCLAVLTVH